MSSFGEKVKHLRAKKGITQEKLAKDLDIPESSIRRLEITNGVPRMDRLIQIANYFGVTTDFLLDKETSKENTMSEQSRDLVDMLDLSDEEIMDKMDFVVDGIKLDPDDIKVFLAIVRAERIRKKQGLALDGNKQ